MRIMFMGTPEFAVPPLRKLVQSGNEICAVITQPDRPSGRGMKLKSPPVKEFALTLNMPVFQPNSLKSNAFLPVLEKVCPELIVVVAYGRMLPKYILDFPPKGCVNLHASLLPKYRGAAPIHHSVINGDSVTGVCTMFMAEGMDTGDVIKSAECVISQEDTTESMFNRLSELGAELLADTVCLLKTGDVYATPQDEDIATYAPMIKKEDCRINWSRNAREICNLIRGCYSWPIAFTYLDNKRIKVFSATLGVPCANDPGTVLHIDVGGMTVAAGGKTSVIIKEMQIEGGKRMTPFEYITGHKTLVGCKLGGI